MKRHKVLVVDDSAFMRKLIKDIVESDPSFEVIATARNGRDALDKLQELEVDAVTLDVEMPEINGLEALEKIMAIKPLPVIMISSLTGQGTKETILALEKGAFDVVCKPSGSISLDLHKVKDELLEKLKAAVQSKPRFAVMEDEGKESGALATQEPEPAVPKRSKFIRSFDQIVAIGTSTGGPRALQKVLTSLPADFAAPIVVVQHMPPGFTRLLAERLDTVSALRVLEAENDIPLLPGVVYIAPGGWHMRVVRHRRIGYRIALDQEEPISGHRPSVHRLFESLLPLRELKRHIVIMTGMGSDGAQAMKNLRDDGAETTIAEAEETCIVYGMPRIAAKLGAAQHVLPLHQIGDRLIDAIRSHR